jgi:hypothetical protein
MNLKSIQGDDNIQKFCNHTMRATLITLEDEGLISPAEVTEFLDNHVAVFMTHDGGWFDWVRRKFGEKATNAVVVCKTYTRTN